MQTLEKGRQRPDIAHSFLRAMGGARSQVIGRKVANKRKAKGWNREKLAAETGLALKTIQRVETGDVDEMRMETANRLSAALGVPVDHLRPPHPENDPDVYELLAQVVSRLQRIELAVGVQAPSPEAVADELEADEEAAVQRQAGSSVQPSEEQEPAAESQ